MSGETNAQTPNKDEAIRELGRQVRNLESRIADVDFWLRFSKWTGISLIVLVAAAVSIIAWLLSFKANVDSAESRVSSMDSHLSETDSRITVLNKRVDELDDRVANVQNHRMDTALRAHASRLATFRRKNE